MPCCRSGIQWAGSDPSVVFRWPKSFTKIGGASLLWCLAAQRTSIIARRTTCSMIVLTGDRTFRSLSLWRFGGPISRAIIFQGGRAFVGLVRSFESHVLSEELVISIALW